MAIEPFTLEDVGYVRSDQVMNAIGDSVPMKLTGMVCVQIAGGATAITATVLRSPDGVSDNYSPVGDPMTGDPSAGVVIRRYEEPNIGFWKVRVSSIVGNAKVHVSGRQIK